MTGQTSSYFRDLQRMLYVHAAWPTPPKAWACTVLGLAAASRMRGPEGLGRVLAPILNSAGEQGDCGLRAIITLSHGDYPEIFKAIQDSAISGHLAPAGAAVRSRIISDRTSQEMRGLVGPDKNSPTWAPGPDFREPQALISHLEMGRDLLLSRMTRLSSEVSNENVLIDGIISLRYLLEALFHFRTTQTPKYGRLNQILEEQAVVLLIDASLPDGDFDLLLREASLRRSELGRSLTRLRDMLLSGERMRDLMHPPTDTDTLKVRINAIRRRRRAL